MEVRFFYYFKNKLDVPARGIESLRKVTWPALSALAASAALAALTLLPPLLPLLSLLVAAALTASALAKASGIQGRGYRGKKVGPMGGYRGLFLMEYNYQTVTIKLIYSNKPLTGSPRQSAHDFPLLHPKYSIKM